MTSYNYLGYGVTNSEGIAKLEYNSEGQKRDHSYTGVGAGEIDVLASLDNPIVEGSIVSETLSVWDYLVYDDGHTGNANAKWWGWSSYPATVVRGNSYTSITPVNTTGYYCFNFSSLNVSTIEFDVYKTGGALSDILFQLRNSNMGIICQYALSSFTGLALNTWYTVKLDLENGTVTIGNQTLTFTSNDETQFCLKVETSSEVRLKEFKMTGTDDVIRLTGQTLMQTGDNNVLSATLYENGAVASGKTVTFYKNGVSVGTDTTNSSGVASYTYEGTGAGELEFTASSDNIVSKTLSIWDTLWYDTAITGTDKIWYNTDATTLSADITPTGTVLSSSASNKRYYANNNNSYGDFTCEFEVVEHTADYTSFVCGNSVISTRLNQALSGSTVKIVREGSTFKQYVDGELVDSQTDTAISSHGIGFRCNANDSIKFKNFKIW